MPDAEAKNVLDDFRRACQDPDFLDDMDALAFRERRVFGPVFDYLSLEQEEEDNAYYERIGERRE